MRKEKNIWFSKLVICILFIAFMTISWITYSNEDYLKDNPFVTDLEEWNMLITYLQITVPTCIVLAILLIFEPYVVYKRKKNG